MSQYKNEMNGRGCMGAMASLLAVPAIVLGLGVAAVSSAYAGSTLPSEDDLWDSRSSRAYARFDHGWKDGSEEQAKQALESCKNTLEGAYRYSLGKGELTVNHETVYKFNEHVSVKVFYTHPDVLGCIAYEPE